MAERLRRPPKKTWKTSTNPEYAVKKARIEHLHAIADGEVIPDEGEPEVIFCVDEFGPLNLQPWPSRHGDAVSGKNTEPGRAPRPRMTPTNSSWLNRIEASSRPCGSSRSTAPTTTPATRNKPA